VLARRLDGGVQAQPKEKRFAAAMEAFAKGFPGVTVEYVTKVFEVFAVSAFRASLTSYLRRGSNPHDECTWHPTR
jgi:hypothetical protein